MKISNKRLSDEIYAGLNRKMPKVRKEHLEDTITQVKALYERQGRRERIGFGGLLIRQVRFIGWKVWLMQFVLLMVFILLMDAAFIISEFGGRHMPSLLCGCGILIVWSNVPVIERSIRYRMFEIENSTLFSGGRLLTARLIIVCGGLLVMIAAVMCLMTVKYMYTFSDVVFSFVLPLLTAASLFLYLIRRLKVQFVIKGCNLAGGISIMIVFLLDRGSRYSLMDLPRTAGWLFCIICLALCTIQVRQIWERENCEEIPEFS